jgi:hypothetical protein
VIRFYLKFAWSRPDFVTTRFCRHLKRDHARQFALKRICHSSHRLIAANFVLMFLPTGAITVTTTIRGKDNEHNRFRVRQQAGVRGGPAEGRAQTHPKTKLAGAKKPAAMPKADHNQQKGRGDRYDEAGQGRATLPEIRGEKIESSNSAPGERPYSTSAGSSFRQSASKRRLSHAPGAAFVLLGTLISRAGDVTDLPCLSIV